MLARVTLAPGLPSILVNKALNPDQLNKTVGSVYTWLQSTLLAFGNESFISQFREQQTEFQLFQSG